MRFKPGGEFLSRHLAISQIEHQTFLFADIGNELNTIE